MILTPELQLETLYALDDRGRIVSTREPRPSKGPKFSLIRSATSAAWAVHAELSDEVASEIGRLARDELPISDLRTPPLHADRYIVLAGGEIYAGPAFAFPDELQAAEGVVRIDDEIPGRSPMFAIVEGGAAVSVCFCARLSPKAAEAGLETAESFRGRGFALRVTRAWALAMRASGRLPIYSTSWENHASLAVARKLGLIACASDWNIG